MPEGRLQRTRAAYQSTPRMLLAADVLEAIRECELLPGMVIKSDVMMTFSLLDVPRQSDDEPGYGAGV